jgi:hypothetical protein
VKTFVAIVVVAAVAGGVFFVTTSDDDPAPAPRVTETVTATPSPEPEPEPSSPAPNSTPPRLTTICSGLKGLPEDDESGPKLAALPRPVVDTWAAIVERAILCDYEGLEDLALEGRKGFSFSFGADEGPAAFWEAREREARRRNLPTSEYMRYLVALLQLPYCEERSGGDTYFIWPRVHCRKHTDADWNDVEGLYPEDQFEQMRASDSYLGFRVGILENGDWVYFIAGD